MDLTKPATSYHQMFVFSIVPERFKLPLADWKEFQSGQTAEQLKALNFNTTCNGIGVVLNNNLRCFDLDGCEDFKLVLKITSSLGLPSNYEWIVKTGFGYHIYFYCDDSEYFSKTFGDSTSYTFKLKEGYEAKQLELKWKNCKVTLPPSEHENGTLYNFIYNDPKEFPIKLRGFGVLIDVIKKYCLVKTENKFTSQDDLNKSDSILSYLSNGVNKGNRHNALISLAGMFKKKGFDESYTLQMILNWNNSNVNPPIPGKEIISQVKDIFKRYPSPNPIELVSAKQIQRMKIDSINWIIPGLLPEGLGTIAGKSKLGKSWLALNLSLAVANGGKALGYFNTNKNTILYIAYEDGFKRLQSRINTLLSSEHQTEAPENLLFFPSGKFPKLNQNGLSLLEQTLDQNPGIRLVIIDTLLRSFEAGKGKNQVSEEYEFGSKLQKIAIERNICILFIHHTTKAKRDYVFDELNGTTGIQAPNDFMMVLSKDTSGKYVLDITGRDVESINYTLSFNECIWNIESEGVQTPERKEIIELFKKEKRSLKTGEIAKTLDKSTSATSNILKKLEIEGIIKQGKKFGEYIYTNESDISNES